MMDFDYTSSGGFGGFFMVFWIVLIIGGSVALIWWFTNQAKQEPHSNHEKSALEILKVRYAKGEIDQKEFEDKKKDLS